MSPRGPESKIMRRAEVAKRVRELQAEGRKVVFTNGCFDILHVGHVRYLMEARKLGDCLVVGLNTDASVRQIKGAGRPIIPQFERAEMLASLECVDFIALFGERLPNDIIAEIKPDIHVKGGDYRPEDMPETPVVLSYGGKVVIIPLVEGHSTSLILERAARGAPSGRSGQLEMDAVRRKATAIIPARLAATRLPRKPLLDICGKPMVQWVYERASRAESCGRVLVATPDPEIFGAVRSFGGEAVMTSSEHRSGTDRLAEAAASLPEDALVINVQGDEPLIDPAAIDQAAAGLFSSGAAMCSLMWRLGPDDNPDDPSLVKVVVDSRGYALYFSRSRIPFPRGESQVFGHVGLYAYRRDFLMQFARMEPSPLEVAESLEQLRALENGYGIRMIETGFHPASVDTPDDLDRVRRMVEAGQ